MSRTLLIDADTLIFSAALSVERPVQWTEWLWTLHANVEEAYARLDEDIDRLIETLEADRAILALSDSVRWRSDVMPTYKHNRTGGRKPVVYEPLREYLHETREVVQRDGLEGDDVLGILATHPRLVRGEKILVYIDKDMLTIPGLHYNYQKGESADDIFTVSEEEADRFFITQTLTGDATDGYPGCPGVGPKRAEKILEGLTTIEEMWPAVVEAYEKAGQTEADALVNARVARVCRAEDYDFRRKRVKLWNPPK